MKRYEVVRDLQGGSFGMDRQFTAKEWLEQAREWCSLDDDTETDNILERWGKELDKGERNEEGVIDYIAEMWQLDIREVKGE